MSAFSQRQRLLAEALGTALLLATVIGSGIMGERLAGGNVAIALLGNTISTGAMLVVLITMLGPISGAHFNPAVTGVFWLRKEIGSADALAYVAAQVAAAHRRRLGCPCSCSRRACCSFRPRRVRAPPSGSPKSVAAFGLDLDNPADIAAEPGSRADLGRALHHSRLLVHGVHVLRQSRGDDRPRSLRHLRRHQAGRCPTVHGGATRGSRRGHARLPAVAGPICTRRSTGRHLTRAHPAPTSLTPVTRLCCGATFPDDRARQLPMQKIKVDRHRRRDGRR